MNLTFAELGDFMPISTCGYAAPLTPMIFGRVVEIEYARSRIGAPVDIVEIGLGQKTRDLVGDQVMFDAAYIADMKKIHKGDGAAFAKEATSGSNPDLKAFAAETYLIVQRHLGELGASSH